MVEQKIKKEFDFDLGRLEDVNLLRGQIVVCKRIYFLVSFTNILKINPPISAP